MNFKEYLENLTISEASKGKYFNALSKVLKEDSYKILKKMSLEELKEMFISVKKSDYDIKGQKMYSTALSHYINFHESENIVFEKKSNLINKPYNRIIYGAPGTGKSYQLNDEVKKNFKIFEKEIQLKEIDEQRNYWIVGAKWGDLDKTEEFIQNGYWENGYTDKYIEKVNMVEKGDYIGIKASFTRKQGGKTIGCLRIKALGKVLKNYKNGKKLDIEWKVTEVKDYDNISYMTTIHKVQTRHLKIFERLEKESKIIKTEVEKIYPISRVTFYDGYTYGQFIGTYKPVPEGENIIYKYIPGPFMKQLVEAYKNPDNNFCLIIEEINRAKVDRVFGNIFQLLDRKLDGNSEYKIAISEDQEIYLKDKLEEEYPEILEKLLEEGLYIPHNLYLWATMNSADQGVYPMDSAFKRRWDFEYIGLNENETQFDDDYKIWIEKEVLEKTIPWNKFRKIINNILLQNKVPEDRLIAPFFIKKENFNQKENIYFLKEEVFTNKILMYLFDDILRHKRKNIIFDEEIYSFSKLILKFENNEKIFKDNLFNMEV